MSWIGRFFRPRKPPPRQWPTLPNEGFLDDWKPGDLGRCEIGGRWFHLEDGWWDGGPRNGQIVRVTGVLQVSVCAALQLRGWPGSWQASCFRKIDEKGEEAWLGAVRRRHAPKTTKRKELA